MATEAKPASPKYTPGQRVEVLAFDFETPGFSEVWMPVTITAVDPTDSGRWVEVRRDNGRYSRQILRKYGKRSRNNRIRAL